MKRVRFGENEIRIVENISKYLLWPSSFIQTVETSSEKLSNIREYYDEKPKIDLIYKMCEIIVDHEDVYHVDIHFRNNNKEKFINSFINSIESVFSCSKSCKLLISNENVLYFRDGFSNPSLSLDENFRIKENWDII